MTVLIVYDAATDLGPAGQLALTADSTPIGTAQGALDGTWRMVLAPERPEPAEVAPRPPVQQLPLTLPEPWHRVETAPERDVT